MKDIIIEVKKYWIFAFFFQTFRYLNLGIHIDLTYPNIEIHVPFGFFKIGRSIKWLYPKEIFKNYSWESKGKIIRKIKIVGDYKVVYIGEKK
ncbi:MAG: hypothetical protein AABY15_05135 [Nanoarchaeota archaeon]